MREATDIGGRTARVGVVCDTHVGDVLPSLPDEVCAALAGVDLIIHAGDVTGSEFETGHAGGLGTSFVTGGWASLEHGTIRPKRPREHHLRRAYALADLYERAGAVPRARELFAWLAAEDPDLADVVERARALR